MHKLSRVHIESFTDIVLESGTIYQPPTHGRRCNVSTLASLTLSYKNPFTKQDVQGTCLAILVHDITHVCHRVAYLNHKGSEEWKANTMSPLLREIHEHNINNKVHGGAKGHTPSYIVKLSNSNSEITYLVGLG